MAQGVAVLTEPERRAARVAESQSGLITFRDLLEAGIPRATIARRVESGDLQRRGLSVYAFAGTPNLPQQKLVAQVLSVDPRAAASHDSAAHLWGLIAAEPGRPHVVVRRWRREHRTDSVVHESLDFIPRDRVLVDGVPVTSPVRTIVDLGATSRWLVESALSRGLRQGLFAVPDIDTFIRRVARRGRRGVGVIRPLLDHHRTGTPTESVLEDRFLRLIMERAVPHPVSQFVVRDRSGSFVSRADFAYPDLGLLIELDGRSFHEGEDTFQSDRDKQNITQGLGWTTLRFTWFDITRRPDYTIELLRHTLRVLA